MFSLQEVREAIEINKIFKQILFYIFCIRKLFHKFDYEHETFIGKKLRRFIELLFDTRNRTDWRKSVTYFLPFHWYLTTAWPQIFLSKLSSLFFLERQWSLRKFSNYYYTFEIIQFAFREVLFCEFILYKTVSKKHDSRVIFKIGEPAVDHTGATTWLLWL